MFRYIYVKQKHCHSNAFTACGIVIYIYDCGAYLVSLLQYLLQTIPIMTELSILPNSHLNQRIEIQILDSFVTMLSVDKVVIEFLFH